MFVSSLASEVASEISDVDAPACMVVRGGRALDSFQDKSLRMPCTDFGLDLSQDEKIFSDSLLLDVSGVNGGGFDDFGFGPFPSAPFEMAAYLGGVNVGEFDTGFGKDDMWNLEDIVGIGSTNLPPW